MATRQNGKQRTGHIAVIRFGGTLDMVPQGNSQLKSLGSPSSLQEVISGWPRQWSIREYPLWQGDSAEMAPAQWLLLAQHIHTVCCDPALKGVVITHGTDTLAWTAAALSYLCAGIRVPIILTGAQRPLSDLRSDGRLNVLHALIAAATCGPGVAVAFGSQLIRGVRARKISAHDDAAFAAVGEAPVGHFGVDISLGPLGPASRKPVKLPSEIAGDVLCYGAQPGGHPAVLRALEQPRGLVLELYASGTGPTAPDHVGSLLGVIQRRTEAGLSTVVVSRTPGPSFELNRYAPGRAFVEAGAIDGGAMTAEAAVVKLMLAQNMHRRFDLIQKAMLRDWVGERTLFRSMPRAFDWTSEASPRTLS